MTVNEVRFMIPMLPPSVNHYVSHKANGVHVKSPEARAFERDFLLVLPPTARGAYVTAERFDVRLDYTIPPGGRGDVDNYNKLILDCCAKAGMLRSAKGCQISDAWFKRMTVNIWDEPEDRLRGPQTAVLIKPLERMRA